MSSRDLNGNPQKVAKNRPVAMGIRTIEKRGGTTIGAHVQERKSPVRGKGKRLRLGRAETVTILQNVPGKNSAGQGGKRRVTVDHLPGRGECGPPTSKNKGPPAEARGRIAEKAGKKGVRGAERNGVLRQSAKGAVNKGRKKSRPHSGRGKERRPAN